MPKDLAAPPGAELLSWLQASLGAEIGPDGFGARTPMHYGSAEAELSLLRHRCGVGLRSWPDELTLTGEDRVRFLNGLVTCDVRSPASGDGTYGFFTDAKGKVLADVAVLAEPERLRLELPPGVGATIRAHLEKYVITDRVEVETVEGRVCLVVAGPQSRERLEALLSEPLELSGWGHRGCSLIGVPVGLRLHPRLGATGYVLSVESERAPELLGNLVESGIEPIGHVALETVRVVAGLAIAGVDLDADTLPQETGAEEAVSYEKGCYLGQEIVARIHYLGQVNRILRGLRLMGEARPPADAEVRFEDRGVGRLTSPLVPPGGNHVIGLGLIHRKAADPGTRVEVGGHAAEVVQLPFESSGG